MKKLFLMIIPALLCGLAFTSCSDDEEAPKPIPSDGLYVIGTKSGISPTNITDLVFTGDDIVSFKTGFGDMVFVKEKTAKIISHTRNYFLLTANLFFRHPLKYVFGGSCVAS